jgi:hypothetical protein
MEREQRLRAETAAVWATVISFAVGAALGILLLLGAPRPLTGPGSVALPAAGVAAFVAAAAFVASTLRFRRAETAPMPPWQTVVSRVSTVALTIALAGVAALGVLLTTEVLTVGLQGIALGPVGGGVLTGVAAALGGRFAFGAGIRLRTADLAGILFAFLVIGTLFAMVTAADPRWWERNFSQLGSGDGAWAFNGTLIVAGLLIATVGAYIGRDLHRALGDPAITRIGAAVVLWTLTGLALAAVGLLPLHRAFLAHNVAAGTTLLLLVAAAILTTTLVPGRPQALLLTTVGVGILIVLAVVLTVAGVLTITALEAVVVGLGLLWMTTLVRVLAVLAPEASRPSARATLGRG